MQQYSLYEACMTNAVVQELLGSLQVVQNQVAELQLQLNKQKNKISSLKLAQTHPTVATSSRGDDSTIVLQLTIMLAQHQAEMAKLHQLLLTQQQCKPVDNNNVPPPSNQRKKVQILSDG